MATYIVWHRGGRRLAGRTEGKLLGDVDAAGEEAARRIARERWPHLPLLIYVRRDDRPSAPPRGALW